jgi:hypothetical protein
LTKYEPTAPNPPVTRIFFSIIKVFSDQIK